MSRLKRSLQKIGQNAELCIQPIKRPVAIFLTSMNILNCIFGSGIICINSSDLALSYATQKSGFGLSIVLLTLSGLLSAFTCLMITKVCRQTKSRTYSEVVEKTLGKIPKYLVLLTNFLFPSIGTNFVLIVSIAYGITIYENLSPIFSEIDLDIGLKNALVLLVCLLFIVLPVSLVNDLTPLAKVSTLSVFFVIFYTAVFLGNIDASFTKILLTPDQIHFASKGFLQALGTFFFAFAIQHNIISLFYSKKELSEQTFYSCLYGSTWVAISVYVMVAICGFVSFPGVLKGNLFLNYCAGNKLIVATRIIFTITILATYPFQLISARDTILECIDLSNRSKKKISYIVSVVLILMYGAISYFAESLSTVLEFGGCLTAAPLVLIIPPLVYMKATYKSVKVRSIETFFMWIIILFGITLLLLGTSLTVVDYFRELENKRLVTPMYWCPSQ